MRKRKDRMERPETLISIRKEVEVQPSKEDDEEEIPIPEEGKSFFACYLLCSLCPRFKGQTYIGFTVNPCRRIRQHNGELRSGAWRTKSKRPWEMVLCIYGFPTNVMALQFEWAWQHPTESLAVRKAAASLKSLSGIAGKIKIAYTMLNLPPWESLKLTVNFFSTKYMKDAVGCKSLPKHMKVQFCPMDELPCYTGCEQSSDEVADEDDEDEVAENRTNHIHSEEPTDTTATNLSDFYHSSVETVNDILKRKKNNDASQPEYPSTQSLVDLPFMSSFQSTKLVNSLETVEERNHLEQACTSLGEDHRHPFHLVDSPVMSSFLSTNLVNSVETDEYKDPVGLIETRGKEFRGETKQKVSSLIAVEEHQLSYAHGLYSSEFNCDPAYLSTHAEEDSSPVKTSFSHNSDLAKIVEDKDCSGQVQEGSGFEVISPQQCPETPSFADDKQPLPTESHLAAHQVEVIDISTPSSIDMFRAFRRKKKRNNWVSQDVIDLTKSPNFIQL